MKKRTGLCLRIMINEGELDSKKEGEKAIERKRKGENLFVCATKPLLPTVVVP